MSERPQSRPQLRRDFFVEHRPSPEMLLRAPPGPWSEKGFPVYEWDGLWYVATTGEFPEDQLQLGEGSPFVMVHASSEDLAAVWESLQSEQDIPVPMQMPPPPRSSGQTMTTRIDDVNIELVRSQLARLAEVYQQAMFLTFEDGFFIPRLWTNGFPSENKNGKYSSEEPSPFKLILKTLKSYHGYFEPSPPTEAFFTDWTPDQQSGHAKYPANITLTPVTKDQALLGAVLCIGGKNTYNRNHLALVEKSARMISDILLQEHTAA